MSSQMSNSVPLATTTQYSPEVWLTDSEATNHMTTDMRNLSLASPYPVNETVQTANGEGLQVSHVGTSLLRTSPYPLKLNSVLYDKAIGRVLFQGACNNGLYPIPSLLPN
ncbi:hypothetical protein ACFX2C_021595 [Malus domestica]